MRDEVTVWKTETVALSHLEQRLNEMSGDGWSVHAMWGGLFTDDPDYRPPPSPHPICHDALLMGPRPVNAACVVWSKVVKAAR